MRSVPLRTCQVWNVVRPPWNSQFHPRLDEKRNLIRARSGRPLDRPQTWTAFVESFETLKKNKLQYILIYIYIYKNIQYKYIYILYLLYTFLTYSSSAAMLPYRFLEDLNTGPLRGATQVGVAYPSSPSMTILLISRIIGLHYLHIQSVASNENENAMYP